MKKQLSLFLASLFLMIGTAWAQTENNAASPSALAPTYSAPSTPVWNYVQFVESSNVLCDLGTGKVTTVAAEEVDNNMWAAVGSNEQFYLMSKLGNYLAYDAEKNCYKASANKKERVALTLKAVAGAWEIMRKGGDKVMSVITTDSVAEAATGAAANKVAFVDLTPKVYDPNVFSTWEAPVYYQVQFKAGGCYILDQGNGKKLTTKKAEEVDGQFWQFIGTPENFYMKSRGGNYVYFKESNFYASATDSTALYVVASSKGGNGYYEIGCKGSNKTINQYGGAGENKDLAEYIAGDTNNPLRFVGNEDEKATLPYFSTVEAPSYWWIKFCTGGAAMADKGAGQKVKTAEQSFTDAQLWQLIGDESGFYMKSKAGNFLSWSGGRFQTSTAEADKATLILHQSGNSHAEEAGCYEIQLKGGSNMNQVDGAGTGKELGTWNANDPNNHFVFVSAEPSYPAFDDEEAWYYMQFGNGNWVIQDKGVDKNVQTAALDDLAAQRWRVMGGVDSCQFISQEGNYLIYDNDANRVKASKTADAKGFKLVVTTNSKYPLYLEVQHPTVENKAFNMDGGANKDKNIALYNANDGGNPLLFVDAASVEYPEFRVAASAAAAPAEKLTLWYTQPATATGVSNTWMEYSLPLGNGQLGASLFGGVAKDQILLNEKTLWSGGPNEYGYYLVFGSVYIEDLSGEFSYNDTKPVKNYYRDLNLKTATGSVSYEDGNGVKYNRQYIVSNPDKAVVTKITASEAGKLSFRISMVSGKPTVKAETTYKDGCAQFTGKLQTVSYNATLKVVAKGGYTSTGTDGIIVEEADEVLLVLTGCTDFVGNEASHVNGRAAMLPADNMAVVEAVVEKGWDAVYADHVADHQKFFNRVSLDLEGVKNDVPTNQLIIDYNKATGTRNLMLEQLYYNYGRYLSIASSRGVDLPNNLQGIWNNTCTPPWHSDIHANINVQMNYWPVSAGNLDEMYEPFLNYIINEAAQPEWQNRATIAGQKRGWTCLTENNIFGGISGFAPNYVIANAWYVTHLWQHYRYTLDKDYLKRAFPAMLGASQFWADRMVLAEDGTYECPNEYSPEHGPGSENAVAHAQQIAWECLDNTLKAAKVLDAVNEKMISQEDYDLLKDRLKKMDKGLAIEEYEQHGGWPAERNGIKAGDQILREWKYSRFYASGDQGHRHMSHLMALYPFGQLTPADTVLFDAAINSMKLRGDESTGWSMGWKINLWARALMGDRSHAILRKALKHSTTYGTDQGQGGIYYNLFDSHAPFQIDGNFGATSGVQEMLMQSHTEVINILPALPSEWSKGSIKGLKAVGNFSVDIEWVGGKAQKATITSHAGSELRVSCAHGAKKMLNALVTMDGKETSVEVTESGIAMIPCEKNSVVVIDFTAEGANVSVPDPEPEPDPDASVEMPTFNTNKNVVYYDLQGRKVINPTKGIYVVGGRKVVIR